MVNTASIAVEFLARDFDTPYRPDILSCIIVQQLQQRDRLTLEACAAIANSL